MRPLHSTSGLPRSFIESEIGEMSECRLAKTQSSGVLGGMNGFVYLGKAFTGSSDGYEPVALSLHLANVPCGPLYRRHFSPGHELSAFVAEREK